MSFNIFIPLLLNFHKSNPSQIRPRNRSFFARGVWYDHVIMWPFIRSPRSKRPRIRPFLECSCWCNFRSFFFLRVFRCSRFLSRIRFHISSWAIRECLVDFGESNSFECLWISWAPVLEAQKRTIDQWIPGCTGFSQEQGVRVAVWEDRILTRRW
jgi:hypothetical protein